MKFNLIYLFKLRSILVLSIVIFLQSFIAFAGNSNFKVIALYTGKNDRAHVSFVHEANRWFAKAADKYKFSYDSTNNWENLNKEFLAKYDIVLFLDTRPEKPDQRIAFVQYMKRGGAWIGFH